MSKAKSEAFTVDAMKSYIEETMASLGATISFDADADLTKLGRGKPMTYGELKALPDGSAVFVHYKEHSDSSPRINGAMRITRGAPDHGLLSWTLDDGSSFGADFTPQGEYKDGWLPPKDEDACTEDCCGEGTMRVFHAVPVAAKPKRKRAK